MPPSEGGLKPPDRRDPMMITIYDDQGTSADIRSIPCSLRDCLQTARRPLEVQITYTAYKKSMERPADDVGGGRLGGGGGGKGSSGKRCGKGGRKGGRVKDEEKSWKATIVTVYRPCISSREQIQDKDPQMHVFWCGRYVTESGEKKRTLNSGTNKIFSLLEG